MKWALNADNQLWQKFINPPDECKTKLWWFHGETETTKKGIRHDLEEFKKKGIGGVVFYDQIHGKGECAFPSMSPEWWESLKYAAKTAKEIGLSFEMAVDAERNMELWNPQEVSKRNIKVEDGEKYLKLNPWEAMFLVSDQQ